MSLVDILFGEKKPKIMKQSETFVKETSLSPAKQAKNITKERVLQLLGKKKQQNKIRSQSNNQEKPKTADNKSDKTHPTKSKSNDESKKQIKKIPSVESRPKSENGKTDASKKKISKEEEMMLDKLTNFTNINDIFQELKTNQEYSKMFPKKDVSPTKLKNKNDSIEYKGKFKPRSSEEAKELQKIEAINKLQEHEEFKMIGKKHKSERQSKENSGNNNIKFSKQSISKMYYSEDDVWCAKCNKMHDKNLHKKPAQVDLNKVFNNSKPIENNSRNNNQVESTSSGKLSKIEEKIKTQKMIDKIQNSKTAQKAKNVEDPKKKNINKNEHSVIPDKRIDQFKTQQIHGKRDNKLFKKAEIFAIPKNQNTKSERKNKSLSHFYSREDFEEEEDDFIVDDDDGDNENVKKYMRGITRGFRRGGYDAYDDSDDLEEAGFDLIEQEEDRTARIGEHEDYIEEIKERERLEKKKKMNK